MAVTTTNLGVITAYGDAVAAGYTGTKAEWQTLMASYATVGQQAVDAKNDAVAAKDIAVQKATDASTAAGTATQKANEASASAQSIAQSAAQITQNTSDINELKEDLTAKADTVDMLKAFPTDTASGSVAIFADGANVPVKSLIVNIDPVQEGSGDPSPDNVRPISGWSEVNVETSGKNIADVKYGNTVPSITNGEMVSANGWCTDFIKVDNSKNYMFSFVSTAHTYVFYYDENHNHLGNQSVLMDTDISTSSYFANARYVKLRNDAVAENDPHIQLEIGSTATAYEPYSGQSITIPIGQTVYGGKLDVTIGVLTVDRAMVDLGTLNWTMGQANIFNVSVTKANSSNNLISMYTTVASYADMINTDKCFYNGGSTLQAFYIHDNSYQSVSAFQTAVTGQQLVYELATPLTISLTPHEVTALLGSNNIWADTGDSAVEYRADPTLYIQRLTEPDADMAADSNITSGSYFMVGNTLYKATANIASGASITPNVNCTRKSLSEALNEINA